MHGGSVTPPTQMPVPGDCFSSVTARASSPSRSSAFQSTSSRVAETTYLRALSMASAKGTSHVSIQSGHSPEVGLRQAAAIIS